MLLLALIAAMPAAAGRATAQEEVPRFAEEEAREDLAPTRVRLQDRLFTWGGWWRSTWFSFDDVDKDRTFRNHDLRIWAGYRAGSGTSFYLRTRHDIVDYNTGDGFNNEDQVQNSGEVDQATVTWTPGYDWTGGDLSLSFGRQYYILGTGMAFNNTADGFVLDTRSGNFGFKLAALYSIPFRGELDQSLAAASTEKPSGLAFDTGETGSRLFTGGELAWRFSRQTLRIFYLVQTDLNEAKDYDTDGDGTLDQRFTYDSNYAGIGLEGRLTESSKFRLELVRQGGSSFGNGVTAAAGGRSDDIAATAAYFSWERLARGGLQARGGVTLIYASGDEDRASVTNAKDGNKAGTDDRNFLGFGYVQTGYSLEPLLSNILIGGLWYGFKPFAPFGGDDFEVVASAYSYWKDRESSAISDPFATEPERHIGEELDVAVYWRIASDVSFSFRFGAFHQGAAYEHQEWRNLGSASLTISF